MRAAIILLFAAMVSNLSSVASHTRAKVASTSFYRHMVLKYPLSVSSPMVALLVVPVYQQQEPQSILDRKSESPVLLTSPIGMAQIMSLVAFTLMALLPSQTPSPHQVQKV